MAEYRYYLIPDAMTRAFPEQFGKQTPTEFFDNIADLEKRYHQLREMPYNNERTWNERTRFPYARLVVGIDRQNPDGAVAIIQVRNGVNYLCDDYRGPYADRSDAQIPQMAKKLVEVIGVDRVRPHTYTQRDGYTWVQVEKDMHITEWLYAHELSTMTRQRSSLWQRYITSRIGRVRSLCLLSATMCLLQNSAEHWQRMAWM